MNKFKIKLWAALTTIGLIGVVSLLFSGMPLDALPKEVTDVMPPEFLRFLLLINPAIFLMVATVIGVLLYDKVNLSVPIFEKLLGRPDLRPFSLRGIITYGVALGLAAGALIVIIAGLFNAYLPQELIASNAADVNIITKLLYGGITEELLLRFGLMSLIVWAIFKITNKLTALVYWTAIVLSSIVFALGHLPTVFQIVAEPNLVAISYIILANSIGGLIFGYAYYRKGLECAFIAHAFSHVTMITITAAIL